MKRFLTAILACLIICSAFAGCGIYDPLSDTSPATTSAADSDTSATEAESQAESTDYDNTLEGLRDYMVDLGYIAYEKSEDAAKMKADLIGAKEGYRYKNGNVIVELYEYDTAKLNDTAKEVIDSVNEKGCYTLYSRDITAYMSDNGKYLLIYTDSTVGDNTSSEAYKTMEKAIKAFKKFNG